MTKQTDFIEYFQSQFGTVEVQADEIGITGIRFRKETTNSQPNAHTNLAIEQLKEYFSGKRKQFELSLNPKGTHFQKAVWEQLIAIPYGQTCTYSDIANSICNPKAVRAVGAANGRNPISIVVPCHRVIGSTGKLTGYAWGIPIKAGLLKLETNLNEKT